MPKRIFDRIKETTTVTGTANAALLGAVTQYLSFASRHIIGEPIYYAIVAQSGGEWEVGRGRLIDGTNFERVVVFDGSSGADTIVSFSAGTKDIFGTIPSERMEELFTKGQTYAMSLGMNLP